MVRIRDIVDHVLLFEIKKRILNMSFFLKNSESFNEPGVLVVVALVNILL